MCPVQQDKKQQQEQQQEDPQESEYRKNCRRFYRQSTSFVSDISSSTDSSHQDEDEENLLNSNNTNKNNAKDSNKNPLVVMEAVDRLMEGADSYTFFLNKLKLQEETPSEPSDLPVIAELQRCGLPTDSSSMASTLHDHTALERLTAIRTQERKLAHERNIQKRLQRVQMLFQENAKRCVSTTYSSSSTTMNINNKTNTNNHHHQQWVTTQQDIQHIQQTLKTFIKKYVTSCVASHPLLAGMRRLVEDQLEQQQQDVLLAWTLDAAVISEAVVAQQQGADDDYLQQAATALTSFLQVVVGQEQSNGDVESNTDMTNNTTITLAIDPTLSDQTLDRILQVLPSYSELHARPTGTVHTKHSITVRTNVDGEFDEPLPNEDLCSRLTKWALHPWR